MAVIGELFGPKFLAPLTHGPLAGDDLVRMADFMGADSLKYLPVDSVPEAIGLPKEHLCMACVTSDYPTPAGQELYRQALQSGRAGCRQPASPLVNSGMAKKTKQQKAKKQAQKEATGIVSIARNKKVRHDYDIIKSYEAGIVLRGSEVKALREHNMQWADAYARLTDRVEIELYGLYIGEYAHAGAYNHVPTAMRKLLLNRREIDQIRGQPCCKGLTLVPEELYFKKGWIGASCQRAVRRVKGDKRQALREQATKRDMDREIVCRQKYRG